jgi:hypothetical protein
MDHASNFPSPQCPIPLSLFDGFNMPTTANVSALISMGQSGKAILDAAKKEVIDLNRIARGDLMVKGSVEDGFANRGSYLQCPGYVYVIEEVGRDIFKVGFSAKPDRRLTQLPTKEPFERKLIRTYETDAMRWSEKWIHNIVLEVHGVERLNGEWFHGKSLPHILDRFEPFGLTHVCNEVLLDMAKNCTLPVEICNEFYGYDYFRLLCELDELRNLIGIAA